MEDDLAEFRGMSFVETRIPVLDALEGFVPSGEEADPAVEDARARTGFSRWYPVDGGHRVQFLYEGGEFDSSRFTVMKGAWDHEHCTHCSIRLEAMTLCFVSESGRYVLLCDACHSMLASSGAT